MLLLLIDKEKNMKKVLTSILVGAFLLLFTTSVNAVSVSPNSGDFSPNAEQTIAVMASPPVDNASSILVRLQLEGATIVPNSTSIPLSDESGYLGIGSCDPNVDKATNICIDFAAVGDKFAQNGDYLFSFKVKFDANASTARIHTTTGNGYLVGNEIVSQEGFVPGVYTISSNATPAPTNLPVTGIEDYPEIVLVFGLATVAIGIGFFIWRNKAQNTAV